MAITGNTVTLILASDVGQGQTATVSYTKPGEDANPLQDLSGREADSFSNVTVTDTILVSNLAETSHPTEVLQAGSTFGTVATQGFHTGDHAEGYRLTDVSVFIVENNFFGSETAIFKIYDSDTDGTPKDELHTLVTPTLTPSSTVSFAAPPGTKLEPNTDYHVVFQSTGLFPSALQLALTDSDDQTGAANWTMEDALRTNESLDNSGRAVKMGVHGVENNAATGDPTVSGEPRVGLSLTADTDSIMDADGLENVNYSYQWIRVDDGSTPNETPITGETSKSYTLTTADEGKKVRVRVSFTDDNSVPEERTSDAYPATRTVIDDTLVSNLTETRAGSALNVGNRSGTSGTQGFHTGDHVGGYRLTGVSVSIEINRFTDSETATFKIYDSDADGTPKDELYTLVTPTLTEGNTVFFAAPAGVKLEPNTDYHLVFQGTGDSRNDLSLFLTESDDQTGAAKWAIEDALRLNESLASGGRAVKMGIHGVGNNTATGDPKVSGEPRVGLSLSANTDSIMDADGLENASYSYQWIRVDEDGISNETPIMGEIGSSYTLTAADEGKRIIVKVSFTDDNSFPEERTSDPYPATGTVVSDTLVSNLAEASHPTQAVQVGNAFGTAATQAFHTGDHSDGYRLTGVSVLIVENNFVVGETATFKVYDSDSNGTPKDEIHALAAPTTLTPGSKVFFAAPEGARLEPDTDYHVALQSTGLFPNALKLALTDSDSQTGKPYWTLEDALQLDESLGSTDGRAVKIAIYGFALDPINVRATPGDHQVLLEWDRLIDSNLDRYQYRHMNTADADWNPNWQDIPDSGGSTTSFTAGNLTNGIEYTLEVRPVYTVSAQDKFGNAGVVKSVPRAPLAPPTQFAATAGETGEIILSWANPNDITITGYQYRYRTPNDTGWNPDWTDIPGSDAATTSYTLSNLAWQVLYTFELRTLRGSAEGPPSAQAQGTPAADPAGPSVVRELRAVVHNNTTVQLYFRGPAQPGDANLSGFEYRYADSNPLPPTVSWEAASSTQTSDRTILLSDLEGDTLYTFEVRAVNENGKQGPPARVQAATTATPVTTTPSAPQSLTTTPGTPYTDLVGVDDPFSDRSLPARVALVDVTMQWEPATDNGNAVIQYVYRYAEGSSVPSSEPWLVATSYDTSDELEFALLRLNTGTSYTLEVAAQNSNGVTGPPDSLQITTPEFTGPHYTLSVPGSADEDETFTITVSRTNQNDGESSVIVEIRGPGENDVEHPAAEFSTEDSSATVEHKVEDDGATTTGRQIRVRIGHVGPGLDNTYSVEWHIVDINNITTQ